MKPTPFIIATLTTLPLSLPAALLPFAIDDFGGGSDVVELISLAPPDLAFGTFPHLGAAGGIRDVVVISQTAGSFSAGVAFNQGGYSSFTGTGRGGLIYDGVAGISDINADEDITGADLDYGLGLSLDLTDCPPELTFIHISAFADLPDAKLDIIFATGPADYYEWNLPLTTVGAFADYYVSFFAPDVSVGTFDPSLIEAITFFHDGGDFENLDIYVNTFEVICVPEAHPWFGVAGLLGLMGLGALKRAK